MFGRLLGCYTIYTFSEALAPCGILPGAKCTLRPNLAFSYIGIGYAVLGVTARHSSSGRQPNFAAWYKEWNYEIFSEGATYIRPGGHHVGHRPTFLFNYYSCILRHAGWEALHGVRHRLSVLLVPVDTTARTRFWLALYAEFRTDRNTLI